MLQISICNLLWRELRYIFLLQHLSCSGCPAWVGRQQLFLLGCQAASLGGAIDSCRRHSLIFNAEFLHGLVSHYSSAYLHLFISHVVSHGTCWYLEVFICSEGKPSSLTGETQQPSWSLTLNYFPSTEFAAQLEADTVQMYMNTAHICNLILQDLHGTAEQPTTGMTSNSIIQAFSFHPTLCHGPGLSRPGVWCSSWKVEFFQTQFFHSSVSLNSVCRSKLIFSICPHR